MRYDYVLFDLDGTLSDTSKGVFNATDYMIEKQGYRKLTASEKRSILGPPLWQSFSNFFGISGKELDRAVELYREYYHPKGCYENTMYDGIVEVLRDLKNKGVTLMVATSKPNNITPKVLDLFGISDLFSYVAAPNPEEESDDKSVLILKALEEVGVKDKSKAVMVGDRLFDILGAKKAGIDSIGVTYGFGTKEEHEKYGATYIVDNCYDIEKIVVGEV
ncbi:MAG: HAD hydrolase-like protein [Eubacteriales bacterium]|nr:HAD hydrolase-like protein [Eubacteriales bacterium]